MHQNSTLEEILDRNRENFADVLPIGENDCLLMMDLTSQNLDLSDDVIADNQKFISYVNNKLSALNCSFGIGGYNELRSIYARSELFSSGDNKEPRRLHLGIDIWGTAGTTVSAPIDGTIHSFANNDSDGDYGATIILQHQLEGETFYTLYGHLSAEDLVHLKEGTTLKKGEVFAHLGTTEENGNWPPHLHFQIIHDMGDRKGDYPGVCAKSEGGAFIANSPNPELILKLNRYRQVSSRIF